MKPLLNTSEICEYLHISRSQFYRLIRENRNFPVYQVGGRWKADPEGLAEWVRRGRPAELKSGIRKQEKNSDKTK